MPTRLTIDQLEKMKTHELADMLANVVLLLRRMPDVECRQLQQVPDGHSVIQPSIEPAVVTRAPFTGEELAKKKLPELKVLAKELNVLFSSSIKKDDLIARILAKPLDGRSQQRAIQDI